MRKLASIFLVLIFVATAHGSLTINPEAVKRATVFIFAALDNGEVDTAKPIGTAFLVSVPIMGSDRSYILVMTARHVLDPSWAGSDCGSNPSAVYVRLNRKTYDPAHDSTGVGYVKVVLREANGHLNYATSRDDTVDAAVLALKPTDVPESLYDLSTVPLEVFATDEELSKLSTGDAIVSAGLVPGAQGINRNYPVFKFGFISDNRPEPFMTGCGRVPTRSEKVWFISINMFPGASGSAIFYAPPGSAGVQFGAPVMRPVLIGIQSSSLLDADVAAMTSIGLVFPIIENLHLENADLHRGPKPLPQPAIPPQPAK